MELFGSSATGCGLKDSEVDFVLKVTSDENLPDCLEKLFLLMKSEGKHFFLSSLALFDWIIWQYFLQIKTFEIS